MGSGSLTATIVEDPAIMSRLRLDPERLGFVLGIFGERVLGRELVKTVKAIEARQSRR